MSWTFTLAATPPGLNGADGLLRLHWRKRSKLAAQWCVLVKSAACDLPRPLPPVRAVYERTYCGRAMDLDNLAASWKWIGDALVAAGILRDDSPEHLVELVVRQRRVAKRVDAGKARVTLEAVAVTAAAG